MLLLISRYTSLRKRYRDINIFINCLKIYTLWQNVFTGDNKLTKSISTSYFVILLSHICCHFSVVLFTHYFLGSLSVIKFSKSILVTNETIISLLLQELSPLQNFGELTTIANQWCSRIFESFPRVTLGDTFINCL